MKADLISELRDLCHDLPYMEHEAESGWTTQEEIDTAVKRMYEIREELGLKTDEQVRALLWPGGERQ